MMEKEQHDSMATVQMTKADYAASEVYSTTSEPPPAYRRETSSVRIAKIIAVTVIASSLILGAFILASSYLQARASCDQMQTLDSILEKELMLETLQELPKAEALLSGRDLTSDNDMQSLDNNKKDTENVKLKTKATASDSDSDSSSSDNSFSDSDEAEELNRVQIKMPLELSLSDLANAIMQQNQKSRMNCVIERRRAEELVDNAPKMTPFGFNFNSEPKKRVTGERMAIFCESGSGIKDEDDDDSAEPRDVPMQRLPIPFGAIPQQYPLTHMPQQQMPAQHMMPPQQQPQMQQLPPQIPFVIRQIVALQQQQAQQQAQQQQQQQQQQQHVPLGPGPIMIRPAMVQQFPIPEQPQHNQPQQPVNGEIRIHLQRIPIQREIQVREIPIEVLQARPNAIRPIQAIRLQSVPERESQSQFPPREAALLRESFGLTNEDLMNIQRLAQERIEQELRSLAQDDMSNDSNSSENDEDDSSDEISMNNMGQQMPANQQQQPQQPQPPQEQPKTEEPKQMDVQNLSNEEEKSDASKPNQMTEDESNDDDESQNDKVINESQILQVGRAAYGRSIITPVNIPVDMMQKEANEERPHFVQPRSIPDQAQATLA